MATILRPDGTRDEIAGPLDLRQLQDLVGGFIEVLYLDPPRGGQPRDVLVFDEDGKRHQHDFNEAATALARAAGRLAFDDYLVGTVVRCRVEHPGNDSKEAWL